MLSAAEAQVQHASTTFNLARTSLRYIGSGFSLRMCASRLVVPAPRRTGHPFAASSSEELSQKIEFEFSASPETFRMEVSEVAFVAQPTNCRTWQPAHRMILMFFPY